jgi:hypothetical protein
MDAIQKTIKGGVGATGYVESCEFTSTPALLDTGDGRGVMAFPVGFGSTDWRALGYSGPQNNVEGERHYGILLFWRRYTEGRGPLMTTLITPEGNQFVYVGIGDGTRCLWDLKEGKVFYNEEHGITSTIRLLSEEKAVALLDPKEFVVKNELEDKRHLDNKIIEHRSK